VSITARDRKIIGLLLPLVLVGVYWFFGLAPMRSEATKVSQELTEAQGKRDTAQAQVGQLNAAKRSFAGDYATVIRMGKAVPDTVDMPSLLVQLDRAARGTGVEIREITVSPQEQSGGEAPTPPGGGGPGAGGSGAQSPMGKAAQNAGNQVNSANAKNQQNSDAAATSGSATPAPAAPGLASVGLQFKLSGDFFDMADFFHRMKRFVRVVNDDIVIRGRLLTIDTFAFKPGQGGSKDLDAQVGATVYLSPKAQGGVSAGASQGGPAPAAASGPGGIAPDPASSSPSPSAPTATATP
jgi:Tfp pilus assembly protein PilO